MISSPLCVITCFSSFCAYYACFVPPCSGFFAFVCIFAYLFMCSCLCLCVWLFRHQSQSLPTISCRFTSFFVQEILSPFQEVCLMTNVSSILQSNGTTDTKSKPTFVLRGHLLLFAFLITCLPIPLHASFPLLTCLACLLSDFYTCLFIFFYCPLVLCFLCLLQVHAQSMGTTSKMQAKQGKNASKRSKPKKGNVQQIRRLSLSLWLSLSLLDIFFRKMSIAFQIRDFLSCILLCPHSQGMAMFDLYFSLLGPYLWYVGNVWFIFPALCVCILQVIYICLCKDGQALV